MRATEGRSSRACASVLRGHPVQGPRAPDRKHASCWPQQQLVTLLHVLNLVWQPILDYVEELAKHDLPWPDPLTKNLELLHLEMAGVLPEPPAHLVMDERIGFAQEALHRRLDVTVPHRGP